MKRTIMTIVLFAGIALVGLIPNTTSGQPGVIVIGGGDAARVSKGFQIAPVTLTINPDTAKERALVGLGSYLANAVAECNDCHTCPSYEPGHNPFEGGDGKVNSQNYLAGGTPFGPEITSANITPDATGKPAGLTFDEFLHLMRTGEDPDKPGELLQVMPWPIFRKMNDSDLRAIYEYLRAIPHAEPGNCNGPGE